MKITIVGAGNVGSTLGQVWGAHGHTITYAVREPDADRLREVVSHSGEGARAVALTEGATDADIVLLATPWEATATALQALGDLAGKIVIDATNPVTADLATLSIAHTDSAGETVARLAPGARVVKAFNTIGAKHMADPSFGGQPASLFLCGDDIAAKEIVSGLAESIGFEPVDAGKLIQSRWLEPLAMLWITMALAYGHGQDIAFKLLRK